MLTLRLLRVLGPLLAFVACIVLPGAAWASEPCADGADMEWPYGELAYTGLATFEPDVTESPACGDTASTADDVPGAVPFCLDEEASAVAPPSEAPLDGSRLDVSPRGCSRDLSALSRAEPPDPDDQAPPQPKAPAEQGVLQPSPPLPVAPMAVLSAHATDLPPATGVGQGVERPPRR